MNVKVMNDKTLAVIKSANKLEDIQLVSKYAPHNLQIVENDDLVFQIGIAKSGNGKLNDMGVEYAPETGDDGLAKISIALPHTENVKKYVTETYGVALTRLQIVDQQIQHALTAIREQRAAVENVISIIE